MHTQTKRTPQRTGRYFAVLLAAVLLLSAVFLLPEQAMAAKYTTTVNKGGSVTVTEKESGQTIATLSKEEGSVNRELLVKGTFIYYTVYIPAGNYKYTNYLERYNIKTGKTVTLRELPSGFYNYDVAMIYKGTLYLNGWNPSDNNACYSYNLSSRKLKKITKAAAVKRYKNSLICEPTMTYGAWGTYPIYIYNISKGTVKTLTKIAAGHTIKKGKIYYAETKSPTWDGSLMTYSIHRYNIARGKKKTLASSMMGYYISRITAKYVYYYKFTADYGGRISYRYEIATGETIVLDTVTSLP